MLAGLHAGVTSITDRLCCVALEPSLFSGTSKLTTLQHLLLTIAIFYWHVYQLSVDDAVDERAI
jgi:hypothetical protein